MKDRNGYHSSQHYEIKVASHLDENWSASLDCTSIICEYSEDNQIPVTTLTCLLTDQTALRGLLNKLFDLNLTILSVNRCNPDTYKT